MEITTQYKFVSQLYDDVFSQKTHHFEDAITKALQSILNYTKSDRCYIFEYKNNYTIMNNTYEVCKEGISKQIDNLQNIETAPIYWWLETLQHDGIIHIEDVEKIEHEYIKQSLELQEIKSLICLPLYGASQEISGFLGIDNVSHHTFNVLESMEVLRLSVNIISNAFLNKSSIETSKTLNSLLNSVLNASVNALIAIDNHGKILIFNQAYENLWHLSNKNLSTDEIFTHVLSQVNDPDSFKEFVYSTIHNEYDYKTKIIETIDHKILKLTSMPRFLDGKYTGRVCVFTDITPEINQQTKTRLHATVFEKSINGILITDKHGVIIDNNEAFSLITGYTKNELIGNKPSMLQSHWHDEGFYQTMWAKINESGIFSGEIWDRRKNGEVYISNVSIYAIKNNSNEVENYLAISEDITQQKQYEEHIKDLAFYDPLTKLANRHYFKEELTNIAHNALRLQKQFGLLFLDLDGFKNVNDTYGHLLGDKLLQKVADILQSKTRKNDFVSRLGGDEFTIITQNTNSRELSLLAQKLIEALSKKIIIDNHEIFIGCSIGISQFLQDTNEPDTLIKYADMAMYDSKNNGKNRYTFFNLDMNENVIKRFTFEQKLKSAMTNKEFKMVYQPIVCSQETKTKKLEALIRWENSELGVIAPMDFIPICEENGTIIEIGEWILQQVCTDLEGMLNNRLVSKVCINISAKQIINNHFLEFVQETLMQFKLDPSFFEFEITEHILLEACPNVLSNINTYKKMGITFSIDDFGTGYSSLSYINKFPVDSIKIDKSFIFQMIQDQDTMAIVETILFLSEKLGKNVIAEGVEDIEQFNSLKASNGNTLIQGYLFSKPLNLNDLVIYLQQKN